jgi:hypothetical protein
MHQVEVRIFEGRLHPRRRGYCDATVMMREPAATYTREAARCNPRQKHCAVPDLFLQGRDKKAAGEMGGERQWILGQALHCSLPFWRWWS